MHLTDTKCKIIQVTQHLRHFVTVLVAYPAISQHAMMPGRKPGQQSGTGRCTARRRRITVQEECTVIRQSIHMGSDDRGITHTLHGIPPMLVGYNENNVRFLLRRQAARYQTGTRCHRPSGIRPFSCIHDFRNLM